MKHEKIGRVSDASVFKATKKHWDEWVEILTRAGARAWSHKEIAEYLAKRHKLTPWWQQGVALGFEIAAGLRVEGQNSKGEYSVTATKSLPASAARVWKLLECAEGQALWLKPLFAVKLAPGSQFETEDGFFGEIRTLTRGRRLRMSWQEPEWEKKTFAQVYLVPRPGGRSILVIDHGGIREARMQAHLRRRWRAAIEEWWEWAQSVT